MTVAMTPEQKLNNRRRIRTLDAARRSPFGDDDKLTLPSPPDLGEDVAPSLTAWEEHLIEALAVDAMERATKDKRTRQRARELPLIPTRKARMKSQEDVTPHLRRHSTEEEDGADNLVAFDPFDAAAHAAWWSEVHEHGALSDSTAYTDAEYSAIAKSSRKKRLEVNDGHRPVGGDIHCELIDLSARIAVGDEFARRLKRDMGVQPFAKTRKAEAKSLGISPRTWRRRRSEMVDRRAA